MKLGSASAFKKVIVWERLQPRSLACRQTSALRRIGMNIVVPILGNVRHHRRGGLITKLHAKAIKERNFFIAHVLVIR